MVLQPHPGLMHPASGRPGTCISGLTTAASAEVIDQRSRHVSGQGSVLSVRDGIEVYISVEIDILIQDVKCTLSQGQFFASQQFLVERCMPQYAALSESGRHLGNIAVGDIILKLNVPGQIHRQGRRKIMIYHIDISVIYLQVGVFSIVDAVSRRKIQHIVKIIIHSKAAAYAVVVGDSFLSVDEKRT